MIANNEPDNAATVNQRMTREEMKQRFRSEWLVIAEPESDAATQVVAGRVFWHGPDRDEARRQCGILDQDGSALIYIGPFPKGIAYAL